MDVVFDDEGYESKELSDLHNGKRIAFSHYNDLNNNITRLLHQVRDDDMMKRDLEQELVAAQQHLAGLETYFHQILDPMFYNERREQKSTIAQRVFSLPELAEKILHYLDLKKVLEMMRVSRTFCDTINKSITLQQKLFLAPNAPRSKALFPFDKRRLGCWLSRSHGFFCVAESGSSRQEPGTVAVLAGFRPSGLDVIRPVGARYRRMFICQPPVQEMEVVLRSEHSFPPIRRDPGLTVGNLWDYTK